jgi:electron transfer flavoprotein alpha subunit
LKLLVLAETDGGSVLPSTLQTVTFAQEWSSVTGGKFDILIAGGPGIEGTAANWTGFGAERVLVAATPELAHPTADKLAAVSSQVFRESGATSIAAPSSTFGRDILPRVAALLDLPMLSDVMVVSNENGLQFKRPMFAGNIIATVQVEGENGAFSVRGTAFAKPERRDSSSPVVSVPSFPSVPSVTTWLSLEAGEQKRPELTTARVVVSGGRPLRDAETFERVIGGLADKLGGAVGATRAAVDSGIAPNELQVGQTGKVVAPELYIAAGISGSVQHMAGMKESKVIVAINTDPDAPIFEVADYGLVMDLHQAVPEMTGKL